MSFAIRQATTDEYSGFVTGLNMAVIYGHILIEPRYVMKNREPPLARVVGKSVV